MKTLSQRRSRRTARPTLRDVAHRAGVSVVTASRALNDNPFVAKTTRKQILEASAALGYAPNLLARGLVKNRTATVGVVILELANPFFAPMLSGIQAVAAKQGFLVVIGESCRNLEEERRCLEQFRQFRIGGIIITPVTDKLDYLLTVRAAGTPIVVMGRRWHDGDYVSTDDVEGGRLAAKHILNRGHRQIALVRRADPHHLPGQDIRRGFHAVLGAAGVSLREARDIQVADGQLADGRGAADRLLAPGKRPSAVFATSDRLALGLVHRLHERGVRVPDDVAVVGYDDIPYAMYSRVPLTTIAVPKRSVGEMAATLFFDRYEGGGSLKPRQILLKPELVVRASLP
jgi:LacI family transcriptional regulator